VSYVIISYVITSQTTQIIFKFVFQQNRPFRVTIQSSSYLTKYFLV